MTSTSEGKPTLCRRTLAAFLLATLAFTCGCEDHQGAKVGQKPPEISGNDIHGDYLTSSQFKGSVVVLYFWTNSCCAAGLKELQPFFSRNLHRGLALLAINEKNDKETVESYAAKNGLTFTLQTDEYAMTANKFGIIGFPTIFIVDRTGIVREKLLGQVPIAKLEKLIEKYL